MGSPDEIVQPATEDDLRVASDQILKKSPETLLDEPDPSGPIDRTALTKALAEAKFKVSDDEITILIKKLLGGTMTVAQAKEMEVIMPNLESLFDLLEAIDASYEIIEDNLETATAWFEGNGNGIVADETGIAADLTRNLQTYVDDGIDFGGPEDDIPDDNPLNIAYEEWAATAADFVETITDDSRTAETTINSIKESIK